MAYRIVTFCVGTPTQVHPMLQMIELLCRSARYQDAAVEMTILTDRQTNLDRLKIDALVSRHDIDPRNHLMLARTRAQAEFVSMYDFAKPLAFLDLDILVGRPLGWLFDRAFDIALTSRNNANMPINGGVILANNRSPLHVRSSFDRLLDIYTARHAHLSPWWGDQKALSDLVSLPPGDRDVEREISRDGVDYLILPGTEFNASPRKLWLTLAWPVPDKYVLHFKGNKRKKFMRPYFDLHMAPSSGKWVVRLVDAYKTAIFSARASRHLSAAGERQRV